MKTCGNCGERVYSLGCVNCDEEKYIAEQIRNGEQPDYERELGISNADFL